MGTDAENIDLLQAFVGCSRTEAEAFIKRYHTVESASNAYLDNNGILPPEIANQARVDVDKDVNDALMLAHQASWDESHFHGDRDAQYGPMNRPNGPSFNIEGPDTLNPSVFAGAGTRPPSRASNYASNTPTEDPMSRSMNMQETGVTNATGNFRPAQREYYDNAQWSMVVQSPTTREFFSNAEPENRKREAGVPTAMKPISEGNYLPSLLTILHAVPMAKEALLARSSVLPDYGQSSDWWDGHPISLTKVVVVDEPQENTDWQDTIHESQRLMAFMELTERAYGSVYNLTQTSSMQRCKPPPGPGDFQNVWQQCMERMAPGEELNKIFETTAHNDPTIVEDGDVSVNKISEIGVSISKRGKDLGNSIYEQLDELLWTQDAEGGKPKDIFMEPGEILTFTVESADTGEPGLGVEIPAVLYSDRYLQENMEVVKKMRQQRMNMFDALDKEDAKQTKLGSILNKKTAKEINARDLIGFATNYFEESREKSSKIESKPNEADLVDIGSGDFTFNYSDIAKELKEVADRVSEKIKSHEDLKDRIKAQLQSLSNLYKKPSSDPALNPSHRYTLRGVATSHNTTYVLTNPSSADDLLDTSPTDWVWQKLTYNQTSTATPAVTHTTVLEDDVLLAAKYDSRKVLLVYASDAAVSHPTQQLPSSLRNFARADNLAFQRELDDQYDNRSNAAEADVNDSEFFDNLDARVPWSEGWAGEKQGYHDSSNDRNDGLMSGYAGYEGYEGNGSDSLGSQMQGMQPPPYDSLGPPGLPPRTLGDRKMENADEVAAPAVGSWAPVSVPGGHGVGAGEEAKGGYASEVKMEDVEGDGR